MAIEVKCLPEVASTALRGRPVTSFGSTSAEVQVRKLEAPLSNPVVSPKDSPEKIAAAASKFEALLLQQMFQAMWKTVPSEGSLLGSDEEQYYRDIFNEVLAENVSQGGGIGIREVIIKDMERLSKKTKP